MRNLSDPDLAWIAGAGTGTCMGSGCPECADISRSCHSEYCQQPVQPDNPIHKLLHHSNEYWMCFMLSIN
ncbi:MAG: hypothetical protein HJJLKODD_01707 [Phycisphaerae bacterium]|nr:hypothetical protein [Phycisphaerae bacterium]